MAHTEELDAVLLTVGGKRFYLTASLFLSDRKMLIEGGNVVVGGGSNLCGACNPYPAPHKAGKGYWRSHLVDILAIYIKHTPPALFGADGVRVPDFVYNSFTHIHALSF
jgi:hypothetical protein